MSVHVPESVYLDSEFGSYHCYMTLDVVFVQSSDSLRHHGLQYIRLPCTSLSPGVCSNSCLLSWWCYLTISSSATLFSFCFQFLPASGSFPMSQLFASDGQSIGSSASAKVLSMNIQVWFPLGLTGLIFLQFKGLSRVFSTIQSWINNSISLCFSSFWGKVT